MSTRKVFVAFTFAMSLLATATPALAQPVPDTDRGNCGPGYHLVVTTCVKNAVTSRGKAF
jgi:hypothetical protein